MKTLSVKQPWAYLLCSGIKDIENRTWKLPEKYKGERVLIHASGKPAMKGFYGLPFPDEFWNNLSDKGKDKLAGDIDVRSAIIGSVRFVDCEINHPSIWAELSTGVLSGNIFYHKDGDVPIYNWVVADPILFDKPILNVKGKLNFWESFHEPIICPECGKIQCAKVEDTVPFATCIHDCEECGYTITESEWERVK